MHFVCKTCRVSVCPACVLVNHHDRTQHDIKDVKTVHREWLNEMGSKIQNAETDIAKKQRSCQRLNKTQHKIKLVQRNQEKEIDKAATAAKTDVDKLCADLKSEVRRKYEATYLEYEDRKEKLLKRVNDLKMIVKDGKASVDVTKSHEFVTHQYNAVTEKLKAVQLHDQEHLDSGVSQVQFEIEPSAHDDDEAVQLYDQGHLDSGVSQVEFKREPLAYRFHGDLETNYVLVKNVEGVERKLQHMNILYRGDGRNKRNVASNKNGTVLAICDQGGQVIVFKFTKQSDGEFKISNPDLTHACKYGGEYKYAAWGRQSSKPVANDIDVADCCIYATTFMSILKFSSSGEFQGVLYQKHDYVRYVRSGDEYGPHFNCITTTPDGRIVVGDRGNPKSKPSIIILTPDGKIQKELELEIQPTDIAAISNIYKSCAGRRSSWWS